MSNDRLMDKIKSISTLTGVGGQYGPDAFAPSSDFFAACALSNDAVYDNKTYGLLSKISGRLYARRCSKSKKRLAMFTETLGKVLS